MSDQREQILTSNDIRSLQWMAVREVSNELGISPRSVLRLCTKSKSDGQPMLRCAWYGTGPHKHRRIRRDWLDKFKRERDAEIAESLRVEQAASVSRDRSAASVLWE